MFNGIIEEASNDKVQAINVDMRYGNVDAMLKMLAWMETLGGVGHSSSFKVYVDGDGSSRWRFKFQDRETQRRFEELKKQCVEDHINTEKDIESFEI